MQRKNSTHLTSTHIYHSPRSFLELALGLLVEVGEWFQFKFCSPSYTVFDLVCRCSPKNLFHHHHHTMPNARVLRDIKARHGVRANEIARRAYLYVARNETLSPQVRHHAQLQLNTFERYTRPTTVKNRCIESGRGRGVISEFGLCRVRGSFLVSLRA